jgi:hypothetical protein
MSNGPFPNHQGPVVRSPFSLNGGLWRSIAAKIQSCYLTTNIATQQPTLPHNI